jgi:hypothetical protein
MVDLEFWHTLLSSVGGSLIVTGALATWLGSVWKDRIAANEAEKREQRLAEVKASIERENAEQMARLGAGLEHLTLVDRIRFEHEYEVYKQAWALLVPLREAVLGIRPVVDYVDPAVPYEDRLNSRLAAVAEAFNAFLVVVEANKPFYDPSVYTALQLVCTTCRKEYVTARYHDPSVGPGGQWDVRAENERAIMNAIDGACIAIQDRIAAVRIV